MCPNCLERIVITCEYYEIIEHDGKHKVITKVCSYQCMLEWFA